jgi:regulator of nucleoside diphosphate kinase
VEKKMARKIFITKSDKIKLQKMVDDFIKFNLEGQEYVKNLDDELNRAEIVENQDIPKNVITMNSKVKLTFDYSEDEVITLVYPNEGEIDENKISILSPIGTAILGYSEGDIIEWKVPNGVVKILVEEILYQPEANLDIAIE